MKFNAYHIFLSLFLIGCCTKTTAQSFYIKVDKSNISIGEHIHVSLNADNIDADKFLLNQWPDIPDSFDHFEIIERSKTERNVNQKIVSYHQTLVITSFDSGNWQIPALRIILATKLTGKLVNKSSAPFSVNVTAPDISGLKQINDVKDILPVIAVEERTSSNKIILSITIVLLAGLLFFLWKIKRKKPIEQATPHDPYKWAIKQLEVLEKNTSHLSKSGKDFYDGIYNICRQYFFLEFSKPVFFYTTKEWLPLIQSLPKDNNIGNDLYNFLLELDQYRFSASINSVNHNRIQFVKTAKKLIDGLAKLKSNKTDAANH